VELHVRSRACPVLTRRAFSARPPCSAAGVACAASAARGTT
jgi:hypothetical protein